MSKSVIQPNEHLLHIHRVTERMDERKHYICLDRNERVTPLPETLFRDILASFKPDLFNLYPDPSPLYARLSQTLGLPEDHLYLTPGSDAGIRMAFQTYLRPGDSVLMLNPTYAMYPIYTAIFKGVPHLAEFGADLSVDLAYIQQALTQGPRILGIPNPNQPTGTTLPVDVMRDLVARAAEHDTLVVVDEAYYPFYPHTMINLVNEFSNLIVLRSFSKVYGLAGLRLGYMAACPEIIQHIQRIRGAHEVNAVAIATGSYLLDHPEVTSALLAEVDAGRQLLLEVAHEMGIETPDCPANFQLLRLPNGVDASVLIAKLKTRGYLVRGGFNTPGLENCIRVTLAGPEILQGFNIALRESLAMHASQIENN